MSLGRQEERQSELLVGWDELPRSQGHPFYDRLQEVLRGAGFDRHVEDLCAPHYSSGSRGRRSLPPGRYFRMLLVGYFEGIARSSAAIGLRRSRCQETADGDSERGIEWRCADSLSLREFLLLESRDRVPDHSWLSRTRSRLPLEVHDAVFTWVLHRLVEHGLITGDRVGVDASTMEANAALRAIVRRDTGEGYREMLRRMAQESGIETPTADDLVRLDRNRPHTGKGKKLSNEDWESSIDKDARIAKMKDGRTRLGYKPEHAVDLDTGAILAAPVHHADRGDTKTLPDTLEKTGENLEAVDLAPGDEAPAELVADKGYHSRERLKDLHDGPWKTRISEPATSTRDGIHRWHGDDDARKAVYANRRRLRSGVARRAFKLRAEIVERGFAHTLDRGGMRRTWLRGRDNVQKRYLIHIAGHNLGLIMRLLTGSGTPRRRAGLNSEYLTLFWQYTPLESGQILLWIAILADGENVPVASAVVGVCHELG